MCWGPAKGASTGVNVSVSKITFRFDITPSVRASKRINEARGGSSVWL